MEGFTNSELVQLVSSLVLCEQSIDIGHVVIVNNLLLTVGAEIEKRLNPPIFVGVDYSKPEPKKNPKGSVMTSISLSWATDQVIKWGADGLFTKNQVFTKLSDHDITKVLKMAKELEAKGETTMSERIKEKHKEGLEEALQFAADVIFKFGVDSEEGRGVLSRIRPQNAAKVMKIVEEMRDDDV